MQTFTVDLYEEFGVPKGSALGGKLTCFLRAEGHGVKDRPAMLVIPGGGYMSCSDREGEPVAVHFLGKGYQAFVLNYSVAPNSAYPTPFLEASLAMAYIRKNAQNFRVSPGQVAAVGFSAGAHLLGLLSTCYQDSPAGKLIEVPGETFRPDAALFSYPVVTSDPRFAHMGSVEALMGQDESLRKYFAIETHVTAQSSPAFIWHTGADGLVPVENAFLLASAYQRAGAPYELHIFEDGPHGLSLCNEETKAGNPDYVNAHAAGWLTLAEEWLSAHGISRKGL